MRLPLDEGWARTLDALAKLATALAIVVGGGWTLIQYSITRTDQLRTQQIEASKPFLEKRLEFYIELTSATATIATSKNQAEVARAKEQFWILYSGPLLVLEEPGLQIRVQAYADCLEDTSKCQGASLTQLSQSLAVFAGNSVGNQWRSPATPQGVTAVAQ
jgi:hypothetical protein